MRATVFHNPGSGVERWTARALLRALEPSGFDLTYCTTKGVAFERRLRQAADLFVVAGGDGTVAKVMAAMPDRGIPLAIVPLGVANNVATALGIGGTPQALAARWRVDRTRPFDVGRAVVGREKRPFVEGVGQGALAQGLLAADDSKGPAGDGMARGRAAIRRALAEAVPRDWGLIADGEPLRGKLLAVEILNVAHAGPALPLAPGAHEGDGMLDVVTIDADRRHALLTWLEGEPLTGPPPVETRRARAVTMTWHRAALRLDDDFRPAPARRRRIKVSLQARPIAVLR